jgi:hypothetical protein
VNASDDHDTECGLACETPQGKLYRAPLVRGRTFTYDAASNRLVDTSEEIPARDQSASGSGMDVMWKKMFESDVTKVGLRPGGSYYASAARSLGVSSRGPLESRMLFQFPNDLMGAAGSSEENLMNFNYDSGASFTSQELCARMVYLVGTVHYTSGEC